MFEKMQEHYNDVKLNLGLESALAPSSEDEKDDYISKYLGCVISAYTLSLCPLIEKVN